MRTREEIEKDFHESATDEGQSQIVFEVMLDTRDLLEKLTNQTLEK